MADSSRVCSWKHAFALDNPIRRLIHNPQKILGRYIKAGQTVLDVGCGPGTFSLAMAKMVGELGKVIAVDVQEVPNAEAFLLEIASTIKPKGKLLIVEPKLHVSATAFEKTIEAAHKAGLSPISEPKVRFSRSKLLSL
jgi:2-polyprenyl-3-methyl-5-hydroxy-6-metoxy-1,4-benzoquinol methylase